MRHTFRFNRFTTAFLIAGLFLIATLALTAENNGISEKVIKQIQAAIKVIVPGTKVAKGDIKKTPLPNIYEVTSGPYVYYISHDGRYLFEGNLLDLVSRKNLTIPRVLAARMKTLNSIGEDKMIVFSPPKEKVKHVITVFTDIDCPYCRLMHNQINQYMDLGIKVRYMLFPRAPANTDTYKKAISVWCSDNRAAALTKAKSGKSVDNKTCNHPIATHVQIGSAMGVTGTPSIISSDGQVIPGFVAAKELIKILAKKKLTDK